MTPQPPLRARRGHSLVELLIAATILIIALGGSFTSHLSARGLLRESRDTDLAIAALRSNMERLRLMTVADLTQPAGDIVSGQPIAPVNGVPLEQMVLTYETPDWALGNAAPGVLNVRLRLDWTSSNGNARTMSLRGAVR